MVMFNGKEYGDGGWLATFFNWLFYIVFFGLMIIGAIALIISATQN